MPFYKPPWSATIVGMVLDGDTDWGEVAELVTESYRFCAPQKLVRLLDARCAGAKPVSVVELLLHRRDRLVGSVLGGVLGGLAGGLADLEHLGREVADRGGHVADRVGDDGRHLAHRAGRSLDGGLHGVLADLGAREPLTPVVRCGALGHVAQCGKDPVRQPTRPRSQHPDRSASTYGPAAPSGRSCWPPRRAASTTGRCCRPARTARRSRGPRRRAPGSAGPAGRGTGGARSGGTGCRT